MTYKKRSISFHNNVIMEDDKFCISPKSTVKSKYADTPVPKKTFVSNLKFGSENDSFEDEQDRIAKDFIKSSNPRGSRFEEDFEEISTVGRGNFGSVVRCRNKLDGIEYAIKITDQNTPKHGNSMIEALQEVYALSALSVSSENPYIVRYYRGWIDNEQLFIQMELCESSLAELFDSQNYDEAEILKLLRHVCLGLNELHEKGIVHLDLKLENIMISTSNKYKLGDLGLSRLMSKLTRNIPEGD
jgi:wee1-like protein kinase